MPTIVHADLDAFYASVEQRENAKLRGKPLVVANGVQSKRGVVAAASYEARAFGVRSAMPLWQALELCPTLLVVPRNHTLYAQVSQQVHDIFKRFTSRIEPIALDEAFLDVTHSAPDIESGIKVAAQIKSIVRAELNLPISLGVSSGKMLAKIACDQSKPDGLLAVSEGREQEFLADLPVSVLWGIGPKREEQLRDLGITLVGQLARMDSDKAFELFGRWGDEICELARGRDPRPVTPNRESKSISSETTFEDDLPSNNMEAISAILRDLAGEVAASVEAEGLLARCVAVKLRGVDFRVQTRQMTLLAPTSQLQIIYRASFAEFRRWLIERESVGLRRPARLRLLGVRASDFIHSSDTRQMSLFEKWG